MDESGDTGFKFTQYSSRHFVVTLIIFEDEKEAEEVSQCIDALRQELHTPNVEFHFAKNKRETRKSFLTAIKNYDFRAFVFVADKTKLAHSEFPDRSTFYKAICGVAFDNAKHLLQEANVQFDDSGGDKFKKELVAYLKRKINGEGTKRIKKVGTLRSSSSNLIQLADMICGAIYRSFEKEDEGEEYWEFINHRITTVVQWPE